MSETTQREARDGGLAALAATGLVIAFQVAAMVALVLASQG